MGNTAFLFAGQGAQKTGMGKSLYESNAAAADVFDRAERVVPGLRDMCFTGEQAELNKTEHTQPCVFTVDMAAYAACVDAGITAVAGAGFSLGEYAALTAAGVLAFEDALELVVRRAGWMQDAAAQQAGGMVAILGKTAEETEAIATAANTGGLLLPVNYNCPGQTVVAGDEQQLENLLAYAKANKIRAKRLPVSGAFHTSQMRAAADSIFHALGGMQLARPQFTLYANKTAQPYDMASLRRTLADQTMSPVLFEHTIRNMLAQGCATFVELGPGATLTGFVKRISADAAIYNINDKDSLAQTVQAMI